MEKCVLRLGEKDQFEEYDLCFDFSYVLPKWERIKKSKIAVSAIDTKDNSNASNIILDSSKQRNTWKRVYLRVKGGEFDHDYQLSVVIEGHKGTKLSPLVVILPVREL